MGPRRSSPESDRGEIHTRGIDSAPSSPTLVPDIKEGGSDVIGQAAVKAIDIDDGQHLNGLDIPRNEGGKYVVPTLSFPNTKRTSEVDPLRVPVPQLADRKILGEMSCPVNDDLGARKRSVPIMIIG